VSVAMTSSDLERLDARSKFSRQIFIGTLVQFGIQQPNLVATDTINDL